jgi:hypothetical protein
VIQKLIFESSQFLRALTSRQPLQSMMTLADFHNLFMYFCNWRKYKDKKTAGEGKGRIKERESKQVSDRFYR